MLSAGGVTEEHSEVFKAVYGEMCKTFAALDEMRIKRLQVLPLISGAGIVALLNSLKPPDLLLTVIGSLGTFVSIGLFFYEARCMTQCSHLITAGIALEEENGITGQFRAFPSDWLSMYGPKIAAVLIYASVAAAWLVLALRAHLRATTIPIVTAATWLTLVCVAWWLLPPKRRSLNPQARTAPERSALNTTGA